MPDSSSRGAPVPPGEAPVEASGPTVRHDDATLVSATDGAARREPDAVPEKLGRYVVLERLGSGAYGVVYAAHDPKLDRRVAVKIIKWYGRESDRRRLLDEARALAQLSHPAVVAVNDVGTIGEQPFVAMAYVEGPTLRRWADALDREAPSAWRSVLDIILPAAEGLSAVHAAGLVHRDVKPDNILVDGRTGRAVLVDFGLALPSPTSLGEASSEFRLPRDDARSIPAIAGTPAYMAPELFAGRPADACSDQFALCVTLFEVLFGKRPFRSTPFDAAVKDERIDLPDRPVPTWLRRAIERGLERDPSKRWPSVAALIESLRADIRRRRHVRIVLAAGTATLLGLGAAAVAGVENGPTCTDADDRLGGVWDDERRDSVRAAMLATALPHAERSAELATAGLDGYAEEWKETYVAACQAHADGVQSGELLDLRMACLRRSGQRLAALAQVLSDADAAVVDHATLAVSGLPKLSRCSDALALSSAAPLPSEPGELAAIGRIEKAFADVAAALAAGRFDGGAKVDALLVEARAAGYAPLTARLLHARATIHRRADEAPQALARFEESWHEALSVRADGLAVTSALESAQILGFSLSRLDEADRRIADAQSLLRGLEQDDPREAMRLRITALRVMANLELRRPDPARAIELVDEALPLLLPDDPRRTMLYVARAWASQATQDFESALTFFERARNLGAKVRGRGHPWVAQLGNNIGLMLRHLDRHPEAVAELERAHKWLAGSFPEGHSQRVMVERNLGLAYLAAGDRVRGISTLERVLASVPVDGPPPRGLTNLLTEFANALAVKGRTDEARARFAQAIRGAEGRARAREWVRLIALAVQLDLDQGRLATARALAERGLADLEARPTEFDEGTRATLRAVMDRVDAAQAATEEGR